MRGTFQSESGAMPRQRSKADWNFMIDREACDVASGAVANLHLSGICAELDSIGQRASSRHPDWIPPSSTIFYSQSSLSHAKGRISIDVTDPFSFKVLCIL